MFTQISLQKITQFALSTTLGIATISTSITPIFAVSPSPSSTLTNINQDQGNIHLSGDNNLLISENTVKTQTVDISNLRTYRHKNKLFSMKVPKSWQRSDTSRNGITNLVWVDKTQNAFVHVNIANSNESTDRYVSDFVQTVFGSLNEFAMDQPVSRGNDSYRVSWSYFDNSTTGRVKLIGNSFVERHGSRISIFTSVVPDDQFDALAPELDKILFSLSVRNK